MAKTQSGRYGPVWRDYNYKTSCRYQRVMQADSGRASGNGPSVPPELERGEPDNRLDGGIFINFPFIFWYLI